MVIAKNSAISLHCEVFDTDNRLLDKTEEPIVCLHGGYDGVLPLVEEVLHGKEADDTVNVVLSSDDAFGEHDPELAHVEDVSVFPVEVETGIMFEADDPATGDVTIYRVTDVADGETVVDGNHPLAGMKTCFKATVNNIRGVIDEGITYDHTHSLHDRHH